MAENVGFDLEQERLPRAAIEARVAAIAAIVAGRLMARPPEDQAS